MNKLLLSVQSLSHTYFSRSRFLLEERGPPAIADVTFSITRGEALGVVGHSGGGKSTLARAIVQCPRPTSGSVVFMGSDLTNLRSKALRESRRGIQMIFQDPVGSLNPRWPVHSIVEEPLIAGSLQLTRGERQRLVDSALDRALLTPSVYRERRRHELSGGQCQRVAIARAIVLPPQLLICDEAVSSLDMLTQSQIIELLRTLQRDLGIALLFIAHDMDVTCRLCDRIAIMHKGRMCEIGATSKILASAQHPHTKELLAASRTTPEMDRPGRLEQPP
jgi:peptide/nickel transport system ATP-binding protein